MVLIHYTTAHLYGATNMPSLKVLTCSDGLVEFKQIICFGDFKLPIIEWTCSSGGHVIVTIWSPGLPVLHPCELRVE